MWSELGRRRRRDSSRLTIQRRPFGGFCTQQAGSGIREAIPESVKPATGSRSLLHLQLVRSWATLDLFNVHLPVSDHMLNKYEEFGILNLNTSWLSHLDLTSITDEGQKKSI